MITTPECPTTVGMISKLLFTDLQESDYDIAILHVIDPHDIHKKDIVKSNPVFLARELGMHNSRPDELKDENRPKDEKEALIFDEKVKKFVEDRRNSARTYLRNYIEENKNTMYRIQFERRIKDKTGYGEDRLNLKAHTRTGDYLVSIDELTEQQAVIAQLTGASKAFGMKIGMDEYLAFNESLTKTKRRARNHTEEVKEDEEPVMEKSTKPTAIEVEPEIEPEAEPVVE